MKTLKGEKMNEYTGYCPECKELKDDDFGQWNIINNEVKTSRGCRDCGRTLTSIETLREILPQILQDTNNE